VVWEYSEGEHDDLAPATAVAAWYAEQFDSQPWMMAVPEVLGSGAVWWR
jgi:hypothetical protein